MNFWAAIVGPGQRVKVEIEEDKILHLSQVSLGEIKKDKSNQNVNLFMHVADTEDLVLSTLVPDKVPQQQIDLIFSKGFEVSHNWKNGTVYFYGYKTVSPFNEGDSDFESDSESDSKSDDEENITLVRPDNEGKPDIKAKEVEKPAETKKGKAANESGAGKQKVKIVEPSPVKSDEDEDESDDTDEDDDDSDDSEVDSSDSEEEEEETPKKKEETPKKGQSGKKRATSEIETETPQGKKAKLITPQKTESKKGVVHVATPYPKAAKASAATNKGQQTPKSAGSHSCKSCNKSFNSEAAIASHNKAKHSAGK